MLRAVGLIAGFAVVSVAALPGIAVAGHPSVSAPSHAVSRPATSAVIRAPGANHVGPNRIGPVGSTGAARAGFSPAGRLAARPVNLGRGHFDRGGHHYHVRADGVVVEDVVEVPAIGTPVVVAPAPYYAPGTPGLYAAGAPGYAAPQRTWVPGHWDGTTWIAAHYYP